MLGRDIAQAISCSRLVTVQVVFVVDKVALGRIFLQVLRFSNIPYILESNLHPFYSFRGLKNQLRIIIACGLDSRSRAGFGKMMEPLYVP